MKFHHPRVTLSALFLSGFVTTVQAMNKAELIDAMASSAGTTKTEANRFINAWQQAVGDLLQKQGRVASPGFGEFQVSGSCTKAAANSDNIDNDCDGLDDDCDGIDDNCDVVCDLQVDDQGEVVKDECTYECKGKDKKCVDEVYDFSRGICNGLDNDCDGDVDFFVDAEARETVLRGFIDQYWIDVITTLAQSLDYNSSRSNKSEDSSRRMLEMVHGHEAAHVLQATKRTGINDNPMFSGQGNSGASMLHGGYIEIVSYWLEALDTLKKATTSETTMENWSEDLKNAAIKFSELHLPGGDDNPLKPQVMEVWDLALDGLRDLIAGETGGHTSISMDESDQVLVLTAIHETLEADKQVQKKKIRGGGHNANLAEQLLVLQDCILDNLKNGNRVSLVGFGSFSISQRAARTGRNPQTGKEIKIAASNVVRFKAGSELSGKVN